MDSLAVGQATLLLQEVHQKTHTMGDFGVRKDGDLVGISAKELDVNGKLAKTGRLQFSDGTFIDLVNGVVVGGNTKEGAF